MYSYSDIHHCRCGTPVTEFNGFIISLGMWSVGFYYPSLTWLLLFDSERCSTFSCAVFDLQSHILDYELTVLEQYHFWMMRETQHTHKIRSFKAYKAAVPHSDFKLSDSTEWCRTAYHYLLMLGSFQKVSDVVFIVNSNFLLHSQC